MPRIEVRFGTAFLLAFALAFVSGLACADDGSGTPIKPKDLPGPTVQGYGISVLGLWAQHITTAMRAAAFSSINTTASNNPKDDKNGACSGNDQGKPIEVNSGTKIETYPIFALPGEMGLKYVLYYNNSHHPAWTSNLQYWLDTDCSASPNDNGRCHQTIAHRPDGSTITFSGGPSASIYRETFDNGQSVTNPVAILTRNTTTGNYTLQDEDALTEVYSSTGQILSITDPSGIGWTFSYPNGANNTAGVMPSKITHTDGQYITINAGAVSQGVQNGQNTLGQVVTVTDPGNNTYTLDYGNAYSANAGIDDLASIAFPGLPSTVIGFKYTYFNSTIPPAYGFTGFTEVDYNGAPYTYTSYVTADDIYNGRGAGTWLADGSEKVAIVYTSNNAGNLVATITNPLGHVWVNTYDGTNGTGGAYNGLLSSVNNDAVAGCGATIASRAYDANGNLAKTVDNNGNIHTYTYAANGQLQTETEAYGTPQARTTDYVWDPDLQLNRLSSVTVEGWSKTVYTYTARNRLASVAVTNLSSNGIANQTLTTRYGYTLYPSGMVQTMTVTHPSPNGSDVDTSQYDALGNLTSTTDGLGHTTTYGNYNGLGEAQTIAGPNGDITDYTYDARGRLATKITHPNGGTATWIYGYDGFGLLASVHAPDGEVTTWQRDPEMRVRTVTHNDKDGTATVTYGYDANSDVTSKTISRNGVATYLTSVLYNALGRPYQIDGNHGQRLIYGYDGNGNVLAVTNATGHVTSYEYDALNRVSRETESGGASPPMPGTAPSLSTPASSNNGTYTVSWGGVGDATYYVLQMERNGGSWSAAQISAATSWSASSQSNGSYAYRVQACNATGCGPWSLTGFTTVAIPTAPTSAPSLSVPGSSSTGSYLASWTTVSDASSYTLQQQINSNGWSTVQSGASTHWSVGGEGDGSYSYRVQACNALGCGPWSVTGTVDVILPPPPGTPSLSVPAANATGSYTVSWSEVNSATSYNLREQVNGGGWNTLLNDTTATSWSANGQGNGVYGYQVQACNTGGCSAWSSTSTDTVTIPVPIAINGQTYAVSTSATRTGGSAFVGFQVSNGSWQVVESPNFTVAASGALPAGATTVQYTWTLLGLAPSANQGGGTLTNPAGSPVAVSSNPLSTYDVSVGKNSANVVGQSYRLTVTFYNAVGASVSSSTATLTATVAGTE